MADPAVSLGFGQQFHWQKKGGAVSTTPTFQTNEYTNL